MRLKLLKVNILSYLLLHKRNARREVSAEERPTGMGPAILAFVWKVVSLRGVLI